MGPFSSHSRPQSLAILAIIAGSIALVFQRVGFFNAVHGTNPISSSSASLLVAAMMLLFSLVLSRNPASLWRNFRASERIVHLRGAFGGLSVICAFATISLLGISEAAVLGATNVIFISLLNRGKDAGNRRIMYLFVIGAFAGVTLLTVDGHEFDWGDLSRFSGRLIGIVGGFFSACALTAVSRTAGRYRVDVVIFSYCVYYFLSQLILCIAFRHFEVPHAHETWISLGVAALGFFAYQQWNTRAFQIGSPTLMGLLSYLALALTFLADLALFDRHATIKNWMGMLLVCISAVGATSLRKHKR
jgi:drug/metabolite transporter (DMT)-like permease